MAAEDSPAVRPATPAKPDPRQVGRYELLEKIGTGGMGIVYRGRDTVIGRPVAVKMLVSDVDTSKEARERFFREARAAGQLTHRNIITIYDFGEESGRAYIVMELLTGESLASLMTRQDRLAVEHQIEIMARVCEGLAFAHSRGIVHRDVKPANLFVTGDGQIKILDFGVARIASSKLTQSGLIVGTPDYMSPEQVTGGAVDARSDVFAAGAVFYQLLSGRKPFAAKRLPDVLHNVIRETPATLSEDDAPAELGAIVMKALEKEPDQRYQHMVEMLASLTRFRQTWDRQTRELAIAACEQYRENERLLAERQAAGAHAGEEVAAAPLLQDLPLFQDRGAEVLKVVPLRRERIREIMNVLEEQHDRLIGRRVESAPAETRNHRRPES